MKAAGIPSCVVLCNYTINRALRVNTKPFSLSKQLQDLSLGPNAAIRGTQSRLNS